MTPAADFKSAKLAASFADDGSENYVFYAVSPASAVNGISKDYSSIYFTVPSSQTPSANSVDDSSQFLFAASSPVSVFPESVDLTFSHLTAYGKLSFINLTLEGDEAISSISLTATSNWAGAFYYYPGTDTYTEHGTAPKSKTITINTSSSTNVWFACAPVNLGGTDLKVIITTNKGTFTKDITIPVDKAFEAGKIASITVNMSGIPRVTPEVWQKKALSSITASDIFVITGTRTDATYGGTYAMPNDAAAAPGATAIGISADGNTLTGVVADNLKWNLVDNGDGTYTFYPNGDTKKWLVLKNTNNGVRIVGSTDADADKNKIVLDASGYLKSNDFARYVGIYQKQDRRCYNSATHANIKDETFAFYVKK